MRNLNIIKKGKNSKGITLVALVITIIILLILAAVTLSQITDNGILSKAKSAVDKYNEEGTLEQIKLAILSAQMKNNLVLTTENLNTELQKNFNDNTITVTKVGNTWYYNGYSIDENGNIEKYNNLLPKEYQRVEYLESTGTQYISLGGIQISNLTAELQYHNYPNGCALSGGMDQYGNIGRFGFGINPNNTNYKFVYGDQSDLVSNVTADSQKHTYKINISKSNIKKAELFIDNTFIYDLTAYNLANPLYFTLFAYTGWGQTTPSQYASCRIYKFELEGQMTLYPCYRKSDNVKGLYDIKNNIFYTNQGSGNDFIAGPNI